MPPVELQQQLQNANQLAKDRKFNAAFTEFETVIRRDYRNATAYADFAAALVEAGKFPKAVEQFRKAVGCNPALRLDIEQVVKALSRDIQQKQDLAEFQKTVDEADNADLYHWWAQVLTDLGQADRAIEAFKTALKKNPGLNLETETLMRAFNDSTSAEKIQQFQNEVTALNNAQAWYTWGVTLQRLRRDEAAAEQFQKAINIRSDLPGPYVNRGACLIDLNRHDEAIAVLNEALKRDQSSVGAYFLLGMAHTQMGDHEKAVANYELAAAKAPAIAYFSPWLESLGKLPNPDDAIRNYASVLETNPSTEASHFFRFAKFLKQRAQLADSAIQFARAMLLDESGEAADELQTVLSDLQDPQKTLDQIQEMVDGADKPNIFIRWGKILASLNEVERAKKQLQKIEPHLSTMKWDSETLLVPFISAFQSAKDRNSAQAYISETLSKKGNAEHELQWAKILKENFNERQQALTLLRKLFLNDPATAGLAHAYSQALKDSPPAEIEEIQSAVTASDNARVVYYWAWILNVLKKPKLAIMELERVIRMESNNADPHYELAKLYSEQGSYSKACEEFEKANQSTPNHAAVLEPWGATLLKAGRQNDAIEKHLLAARARAPYLPELPANIAGILPLRDKFTWNDALVKRFQEVFDDINQPESYHEWGTLLAAVKRPEQAIQQFKKAIELDPDINNSHSEWLKTIGYWELTPERIADYEQSITKYWDKAETFRQLGDFLYGLRRTDLAAEKYRLALEKDPKHSDARGMLINCLILSNDINEARNESRRLIMHDPSNGSAYNLLSWAAYLDADYKESAKQAELGIEKTSDPNPTYLYNRWAWALYKAGNEDLAIKKFQEALAKDQNNLNTHYQFGLLLMEMSRYDEAIAEFEYVKKLKPDHVYANHNLGAIPYDQGHYEEGWEKLQQALKVYEQQKSYVERVIESNDDVDGYEAFYHATVVMATKPNKHDEAELILKKGLEFDPEHYGIMRMLAELNWDKREEFSGSDSDRHKSKCHWEGLKYFQRAKSVLEEQLKRYPNYWVFLELGELYFANSEFEKARSYFELASKKDEKAFYPAAKLGIIKLREREPENAIKLLKDALKLNPYDWDTKSSLAEAYLRAEKLEDAESTYREVISVAPNHVPSYVGLGEVCIKLGETKDVDRYSEAIDHFTRAIETSANEKIRSKYLKKQERAAVCYQRGYARVQLYESLGIRRDTKLLKQAQADFDNCIKLNPSHQKARRAKEKIDKRLEFFSRDRLTETTGPRMIFWASVVILVVVQFAFFGMPFLNRPSLMVTDKSLQSVAQQAPPDVVKNLAALKNQKFPSREELANAAKPLFTTDVDKLTNVVLQSAEMVKPFENFPDLAGGYYALLTFGSLLFMVVGLYLPQILKLRVAGIELEKSSVDQATTGTLGISKLG